MLRTFFFLYACPFLNSTRDVHSLSHFSTIRGRLSLKMSLDKICLILPLIFLSRITTIEAQRPQYGITVTLDTAAHTLIGTIDITYTNQSNQTLDSLGIHLWPNAYKERNTDLVKQKLNQGDLTLYRTRKEDLGGLYDLNFSSTDQSIHLLPDPHDIDIGWIQLDKPLLRGETIHLSSPYSLKIPKSFSRLGRTGNTYQITQWYPHLAVFDQQGWHTMPYLDQGEFFNDFADYKITINTPGDYKVAATGSLISTQQNGTLTEWIYHAANVIDFAWFTSPMFIPETKMIDVGGNQKIELNIYHEPLHEHWGEAIVYAERAMKFYSDWLGPYPYPQMTVVYTPDSKAGYMEYPMVAQISSTSDPQFLDRVITHEIGHTWLYAILANNERESSWLDEGFNTFLEYEYMHTYYDNPVEYALPTIVNSRHSMDSYDALQHIVRSTGGLEPPVSKPERQKSNQYIFSAYMLPAQGLKLLMAQVGRDTMQMMFRNYFEEQKFSHVTAEEVQHSFEEVCKCNLTWFFRDWLNHAHEIDYRITNWDPEGNKLIIENRGPVSIPLFLSEFSNEKHLSDQWFSGFKGEKVITVDEATDEIRVYDGMMSVNKKWQNNVRPKKLVPAIGLFPKIGSYDQPTMAFTPIIGYNLADGGMPGIAITTDLIPQPRLKFLLMPMYGLESKKFRGYGEGRFISDIHNNTFDKVLLGFAASSFGYNVDTHYLFRDHYTRLSPSIAFRMKENSKFSHVTRWVKYRYVDIKQYYGRGVDFENYIYADEQRHYGVHELSFQISSDTVLQPYKSNFSIQAGQGFVRLNLSYNQHFRGKDQRRGIWIHGFAGWLPVYKQPKANVAFTFNGISSSGYFSKDYMYDEWLLGRNAPDGNISRQVFLKDAGLKTLANFGISEKWMAGAGFSAALPFKVVHFYLDAATYDGIAEEISFSYSGGLAIILMKDAFEIYIPFIESKDIRNSLTYQVRKQWYDRISFQANFKLKNPLSLLDHYQYQY